MKDFKETLKTLRWDDHRYYHHSRINQALHLVSAISFLCAYALLFVDPAIAALVAWLIGMCTRQSGHFFFEPTDYDEVNQATHEHKELIKVGYNLRRKVVLMALWALAPVVLLIDPTLLGTISPYSDWTQYLRQVGISWLILGIGGLLGRTVQLFFIKDVETGLAWCAKIITDPINDIRLYYKAPIYLWRGELIAPGEPVSGGHH